MVKIFRDFRGISVGGVILTDKKTKIPEYNSNFRDNRNLLASKIQNLVSSIESDDGDINTGVRLSETKFS